MYVYVEWNDEDDCRGRTDSFYLFLSPHFLAKYLVPLSRKKCLNCKFFYMETHVNNRCVILKID